MNLNDIHSPADIRNMSVEQLSALANELRRPLLEKLSRHGGHIGPNLGMAEAIVALHYVFDTPNDKVVFDVSHQSYIHKMLTGRMIAFTDPAHYDDVSGYTEPSESEYDLFTVGHTSTSVALASGLAVGRDLRGEDYNVIAVIGDGSLSGGEAFEALDFAGTLPSKFVVVVNDNDMSIAENHGALYDNLRHLRETDGQYPDNYFRTLGYDYRYVAYGNDVRSLIEAFKWAKEQTHPVVVHICTQKGKGYAPAEADRERWHWGMPFDLATGETLNVDDREDYTDIFVRVVTQEMQSNPASAVITAGTPGVLGFGPEARRRLGRQFIDVGIAEQQAVAMASGIAKAGGRPVFGVMSSFLQRTYDQLSQDVAINGNAAVINIMGGSVMGLNDVTHLGWFDIALVSNIPGWVYLAPTNAEEYVAMLTWAMRQTAYPVAVRMPVGKVVHSTDDYNPDYDELNRFRIMRRGCDVAIIAAGSFFGTGEKLADMLEEQGVKATLVNPQFLSGVDTEMLGQFKRDHRLVVTIEDGVLDGGFGEKVARFYGPSDMKVKCYGVAKKFEDRYDRKALLEASRLTPAKMLEDVEKILPELFVK